jgi:hypothetical protein
MRRILFLAFCCLALAAAGCAVTDFGIITDNDQRKAGSDAPQPVINTNGKAHLMMSSRIATIWPDGTDELFHFVDQKADGTATLNTYNNFQTFDEPTFFSDLYCNTDWSGCSIFTAPDDNDGNLFDGTTNPNCHGARSLSILLSTGRYYGECGKRTAKLSIDEKVAVLNGALQAQRYGRNGLLWSADGRDTTITARNLATGASYVVPLMGAEIDHFLDESGRSGITRFDHAMLGPASLNFAGMLEHELNGEAIELTVGYNGVATSFTIAGGANELVRRRFRLNSRRF